VSEARGGSGNCLDGRDTVRFGKYRSVSNESRTEASRGTKCCCFSGSFGRGIDDISIEYVAKLQVWMWTVESRSSDYGTYEVGARVRVRAGKRRRRSRGEPKT
jgi:hypothetical protein